MENNHDYTVDESDQANIQTKEFGKDFAYDNEKDHAHIHIQEIFADTDETDHAHEKMRGINSLRAKIKQSPKNQIK